MAKNLLSDSGCSDIDFENLLLNKSLNDKNFITLSDQRSAEKNLASELSVSNHQEAVEESAGKQEAEAESSLPTQDKEIERAMFEFKQPLLPDGYTIHSENNQLETFHSNYEKHQRTELHTIEDNIEDEDEEKDEKMRSISLSKISPDNEYNSKTSQGSKNSNQDPEEVQPETHQMLTKPQAPSFKQLANANHELSFNQELNLNNQDRAYQSQYSSNYGSLPLRKPSADKNTRSVKEDLPARFKQQMSFDQSQVPQKDPQTTQRKDADSDLHEFGMFIGIKSVPESEYKLSKEKTHEKLHNQDLLLKEKTDHQNQLSDSNFFEEYFKGGNPPRRKDMSESYSSEDEKSPSGLGSGKGLSKKANFNSKLTFTAEIVEPKSSENIFDIATGSKNLTGKVMAGFNREELSTKRLLDTGKRSFISKPGDDDQDQIEQSDIKSQTPKNIFRSFTSRNHEPEVEDNAAYEEDESQYEIPVDKLSAHGQSNQSFAVPIESRKQSKQSPFVEHRVSEQEYISIEVDDDKEYSRSSFGACSLTQGGAQHLKKQDLVPKSVSLKPISTQLQIMFDLNKELDSFFRKQEDQDEEPVNPFTKKQNQKPYENNSQTKNKKRPDEVNSGQQFPQPRHPPKPVPQTSIDWTALTKQEPQQTNQRSATSSIQDEIVISKKASEQSKNLSSFSIQKPEVSGMNFSKNRSISRDFLIESKLCSPRQREHSR